MSGIEKPVFVVAIRDEWVRNKDHPRRSIPCFGDREDAEAFARDCAEQSGDPLAMFRIVKYSFSGQVTEA